MLQACLLQRWKEAIWNVYRMDASALSEKPPGSFAAWLSRFDNDDDNPPPEGTKEIYRLLDYVDDCNLQGDDMLQRKARKIGSILDGYRERFEDVGEQGPDISGMTDVQQKMFFDILRLRKQNDFSVLLDFAKHQDIAILTGHPVLITTMVNALARNSKGEEKFDDDMIFLLCRAYDKISQNADFYNARQTADMCGASATFHCQKIAPVTEAFVANACTKVTSQQSKFSGLDICKILHTAASMPIRDPAVEKLLLFACERGKQPDFFDPQAISTICTAAAWLGITHPDVMKFIVKVCRESLMKTVQFDTQGSINIAWSAAVLTRLSGNQEWEVIREFILDATKKDSEGYTHTCQMYHACLYAGVPVPPQITSALQTWNNSSLIGKNERDVINYMRKIPDITCFETDVQKHGYQLDIFFPHAGINLEIDSAGHDRHPHLDRLRDAMLLQHGKITVVRVRPKQPSDVDHILKEKGLVA